MTVYVSAYGAEPPNRELGRVQAREASPSFVLPLSNKNAPQAGTSFQDESLESTISAVRKAMAMMVI